MSDVVRGDDTMMEYLARAQRYDEPITSMQRVMLGHLSKLLNMDIDIDSLTYGTAGRLLLELSRQLKYLK